MTLMVLVAVEDLMFLAKIQQAAQRLGVSVEAVDPGKVAETAVQRSAHAVIFDLNHRSGLAVEAIRKLKSNPATARISALGFVAHVEGDLIAAAREAGCDFVLARSAFSQQLPALLGKLAGKTDTPPDR